ncbi:hypothetical protein D3C75_1256210 [compost metagenome]
MLVALAAGEAAAVEELQHLDRQLATHAEPIAEIGGIGAALLHIKLTDQCSELFNALA